MNLIPTTVGIVEILLILAAILFHKAKQRSQLNSTTRDRSTGDARLCAGAGSANIVQYRLRDLEKATDYFSDGNRLGKGGFGEVYKGRIDGEIVAIKLLNGSSVKLLEDIAKEVSLLSSLNNKNLVKLLGFCSEAGRYLLVYEFISNGDLRGCLIDNKRRETLNWETRFKIIEGIAAGLSYLHHNSKNVVIHRDLKPENILLDKHYTPKIADFGLSSVFETGKTHKSTRKFAGTPGYFAPELWFQWQYSTSSDVYSYGLLVLEILAGCTIPHYARANQETLSHAMWKQWRDKKPLAEVIDSSLHENCAMDQITRCYVIGLLCVQLDPKRRPGMELVLEMLHDNIDLPTPSFPGFFQEYARAPDSRNRIEIDPVEYERTEDSNTSVEYQPTEYRRPGDARNRIEIDPVEYERPEDSNTSVEYQPTEYRRPGDTHTSGLQPSFVKEYSLKDLKIVTNNFSCISGDEQDKNYKGLLDGQPVTVVKYSYKAAQRLFLFTPPAVSIERKRKFIFFNVEKRRMKKSTLIPFHRHPHPNIINILGYCSEVEDKVFVIYEYSANGSLYDYLIELKQGKELAVRLVRVTFGNILVRLFAGLIRPQHSEWRTRLKIIKGVANGIGYLHYVLQEKYLHTMPSNIFLDDYWNTKLFYDPASRYDPMGEISTIAIRGTIGYIAPEVVMMSGNVSGKADVYIYGVSLLQILSGKQAIVDSRKFLTCVAWKHWEQNSMLELLDPRLKNNCPEEEALRYFQIALLCVQYEPETRPNMQQVSQMFNSKDHLPFPTPWSWTHPPRGVLDSEETNLSGGSLDEETLQPR